MCLNNVAACLIALDRFDEAYGYAREALDLAVRYAMKPRMLWALHHLAAIEALRPRTIEHARAVVRAARVMGYVDARIAEIELKYDFTDRQENERVRLAFGVLDVAERESALAAGAAMTQDEAIEEALGTATAEASAPALGGDVDFERSGTTGWIRDL